MIAMDGVISTCIPDVELRHYLDPLDTDGGPLQSLAPRGPGAVAETTRQTASASASDVASTAPDAGYPLTV